MINKIKNKIIRNNGDTINTIKKIKSNSKTISFTNGCFDIIHRGHIEYLAQASSLANIFIIGLNTDQSVNKLKGENRPIQDQESRAVILAALEFVDYVIFFNEDTPYELIKIVEPNFLIKGSDYKPEEIVGYDILKQYGGEVKTIDFVKGYSTSKIIDKIIKQTD
jgi:rfaE bifunctional protein nucleotidyltransferase chain/domain